MARARELLADLELTELFVQGLGWDRFRGRPFDVEVDGCAHTLEPVAEKCGFAVFTCRAPDGRMPDYPTRRNVEQKLRKLYHEHIIVFVNGDGSEQRWLWVRREPGKPAVGREQPYSRGQPGDSLLQHVRDLVVELDEEVRGITVVDIVGRVRKGFDRDKVSKKFYDRFKDEHAKFLKFIKGIDDEHHRRWYASLMLNRLMFIYFVQKKGFLGEGDVDYLSNKLEESKGRGRDRFYLDYLCPLFFEGFAKKEADREPKTRRLLGKVPYLNGGIFLPHKELEDDSDYRRRPPIADAAFGALFSFFEEFDWVLQPRSPGYYAEHPDAREEISPDVLGYIFEKYINAIQPGEQKAKGAYYTKEDITEYIGRSTIVPRILDIARKNCKVAFEGEHSVWRLLRDNPDRYIFEPVRRGVIGRDGKVLPESKLPGFVQKGMHDPKARMTEKRYNLGDAELLDDEGNRLTLPTETWREYVARRQRCLELRDKLAKGEVKDVNDLITHNLDLRQFAQDIVEDADPDLLRALWHAVEGITILDPTVGSGAFLFAALNILLPLYEACLQRMRGLLEEQGSSGKKHRPEKYKDFKDVLARVALHANERYFILKTIVVNNLYGVDIMDEAVEICKLRLFLKLVAQIDQVEDIEPLPDIDFNIRAGNTLVGYATYEQVKRAFAGGKNKDGSAVAGKLDFDDTMSAIEEKAREVERLTAHFRCQQTELGGEVSAKDKAALRKRLEALEQELNRHLAGEYKVRKSKSGEYENWLESHKPFHWFIEFYGIVRSGGFDAIIGNPPFVEHTLRSTGYGIHGYNTLATRNLYPFVIERAVSLQAPVGRLGMIAPLGGFATARMETYQELIWGSFGVLHLSHYSGDANPSRLFEGVKYRLTFILGAEPRRPCHAVYTTSYVKWFADERGGLFGGLCYSCSPFASGYLRFARLGSSVASDVLLKLLTYTPTLGGYLRKGGSIRLNYHRSPVSWIRAMDFEPRFKSDSRSRSEDHLRDLFFASPEGQVLVGATLNSSLFFLWFVAQGNCRDITSHDLENFPVGVPAAAVLSELRRAFRKLMVDLDRHSRTRVYNYRTSGRVEYQEFYPKLSKNRIDEIDQVLAKHFGFTDKELDFIINYDIKYRMGRGAGDNEQ
ncbi:SAM-dependent methyltransferase [candidate division WOR-3 bacterium]|nr:SAM-dependent methyltransferase [candidate division WOR-3 bacterium]